MLLKHILFGELIFKTESFEGNTITEGFSRFKATTYH